MQGAAQTTTQTQTIADGACRRASAGGKPPAACRSAQQPPHVHGYPPAAKPRVCCAVLARLPSWLRSRVPTRLATRARDCMAAVGMRLSGPRLAPGAALLCRRRLSRYSVVRGSDAAKDQCAASKGSDKSSDRRWGAPLSGMHGACRFSGALLLLRARLRAWIDGICTTDQQ